MGFAEKIMEKAYSDINKRLNYFEQYKKEILAASNINYELRQKLMLVPQKYWDDFNQYLLKDPEFRKALSAANPKKEEKSKLLQRRKKMMTSILMTTMMMNSISMMKIKQATKRMMTTGLGMMTKKKTMMNLISM